MLLPMYFLIGIWGGVRREYASIKFFLYTLVGSLFILVVMIALYNATIDPAKTAVQLKLASETSQVTPEIISEVQKQLANQKIAPKDQVHTFSIVAHDGSEQLCTQCCHWSQKRKKPNGYFAALSGVSCLIYWFRYQTACMYLCIPGCPMLT